MLDLGPALGVPGLRAAVSSREDGTMGFTGAPEPAAVREARRRFLAGTGFDPAAAAAVRQVHGRTVLRAGPADRGRGGLDPALCLGDADGLVTRSRGLPLLMLSADCAVVALASEDGGACGVVHAGWRGAAVRAPGAAAAALCAAAGVGPGRLRAAFGPAIGPCCYEVGSEVREAFAAAFGAAAAAWFREGPAGRPHLDLPSAVRAGLLEAGLEPSHLGPPGPCTRCGGPWFSHRRGDAGRQLLAVALT